MENKYQNIDPSMFAFVNENERIHDKKLETKPVGYFKDAFLRFCKNKASITALIIIVMIAIFAILAPIVGANSYTKKTNDTLKLSYTYLPPKSKLFGGNGFWDGTQRKKINENEYYKWLAMEIETGDDIITKVYGTSVEFGKVYYDVRIDKYRINNNGSQNGVKYISMLPSEYEAIQKWQDENNIQVFLPIVDKTWFTKNGLASHQVSNYWWYQVDQKGNPIVTKDANGNVSFTNVYLTTGSDDYTSKMRIAGDDGSYRYAQYSGSSSAPTYNVRIYSYNYFRYVYGFEPAFTFGTEGNGYDIITRLGKGAQFSFILAIIVSAVNFFVGTIYGAIEGYYGGKVDLIMERISDILGGIPFMVVTTLFQLHLASKVGAVPSLMFAFFTTGWLGMAGTVRMQFYRYKNQEYVLAARTLGAKDWRVMFKHIFPNSLGTIITGCVLVIPSVIFSESSLTYLGIVNLESSTMTSVGTMLANAAGNYNNYPHIILFPAIYISLLMITFNLFGNGLRDAFNPSLRGAED